jgi:hypothetical protein
MDHEKVEDLATTAIAGGPKVTNVRIWALRARMSADDRKARAANAISEGRTTVPAIKAARGMRAVPAQTDRKTKARHRVVLTVRPPASPIVQTVLALKVVQARRVARVLKVARPVRPRDANHTAEVRTGNEDTV